MEKNDFHYVAVLLDLIYGIDVEEEDLEEIGLRAWDLIGNKNTRLYSYQACVDSDNSITLPCNAVSVESVTTSYEDWNRVTNFSENGDLKTSFIENHIELQKLYQSPYYQSGKLVSYNQIGNTLYFSKNYGTLNILYKGVQADDDGLPQLTDKEANAIATFIAYVDKYKESIKTNNKDTMQLAMELERKWLKQCDQARISSLSQNDMNEILNIKDTWNRHQYGYSFKFVH